MGKNGKKSIRAVLWPALSILLLVGMGVEAHSRVKPDNVEVMAHQNRCKTVIDAFPMNVSSDSGTWYGQDVKQPDAAIKLLRPNVILSRDYTQAYGPFARRAVSLLIVDCTDAQDLEGHYPPRCYPAQGQKLVSSESRTWQLKGLSQEIHGMEYHFDTSDNAGGSQQIVYNFFVTPYVPGRTISHPELNGALCPDIESVYTSGQDYQRRYYGAAEFQLVTSSEIPRDQIDRALVELLEPNVNVIKTLMNRADAGGK